MLLEAGAKSDRADANGELPLDIAAAEGHEELLPVLEAALAAARRSQQRHLC